MFAPFVTGKPRGTGLGLSIVRELVTVHGGEVGYRRNNERGTTFFVDLPWRPPHEETRIEPASASP